MERSFTEPSRTAPGAQAQRPLGQTAPAAATGGFFSRSPFMAGMMGGLIGVGLGGLLFGNGLFGGLAGFAGFLGLLLQIAIIGGLVWLLLRLIRGGRRPAVAGLPNGMARTMDGGRGAPDLRAGGGAGGGGGRAAPAAGAAAAAVTLSEADFDAFERTLTEVNAAWSRQDLPGLQRVATPEMVQYFADDMADLASRGLRNETHDVKLEQGDLSEAWREGKREFASVAMRFSMVDVTRRVADGVVVEGDAERRTEATEVWTFVRSQGGTWLLSAIQQTG
jgi:predicted lipid-binding transport protein (Tim44 family)